MTVAVIAPPAKFGGMPSAAQLFPQLLRRVDVGPPSYAGISVALRDEGGLVGEEELEQGGSPERRAVTRPEAHPVIDLPVQAQFVRPVAIVRVRHAVGACRLHIGEAAGRGKRECLDQRRIVDQRNLELAEGLLGDAVAGGDAGTGETPAIVRKGGLARNVIDRIASHGDAERGSDGARGKGEQIAGGREFAPPLVEDRLAPLSPEQIGSLRRREVSAQEARVGEIDIDAGNAPDGSHRTDTGAGAEILGIDGVLEDDVRLVDALGMAVLAIEVPAPPLEPGAVVAARAGDAAGIIDPLGSSGMVGDGGRADQGRAGEAGCERIPEAEARKVFGVAEVPELAVLDCSVSRRL